MHKYRYVDSLRGLAILGVVFIHSAGYGDTTLFPPFLLQLVEFGQYGVQLFFVTSAFTLFLSLKKRNEFHKEKWVLFFCRRFFRIAPMYYLGVVFYCFYRYTGFYFFVDGTIRDPLPTVALWSNLFFMHGFHPNWMNSIVPGGWSVAAEMLFYLSLPLLYSRIKNLNASIVFLATSLLISAAFQLVLNYNPYWDREYFIYCSFPNQLPVFACGIIAFFIVVERRGSLSSASMIYLLFAVVAYSMYGVTSHLLYTAIFTLLLIILSKKEYKVFVNPLISFIGKVSFSIYIVHAGVIFLLDKLQLMDIVQVTNQQTAIGTFLIRYFMVLVLSTNVSYVTYKVIELPFQKLGTYLVANARKNSN